MGRNANFWLQLEFRYKKLHEMNQIHHHFWNVPNCHILFMCYFHRIVLKSESGGASKRWWTVSPTLPSTLSEAQRIHDPQMLTEKAKAWGVWSPRWSDETDFSMVKEFPCSSFKPPAFLLMFFLEVPPASIQLLGFGNNNGYDILYHCTTSMDTSDINRCSMLHIKRTTRNLLDLTEVVLEWIFCPFKCSILKKVGCEVMPLRKWMLVNFPF